ncbi:hypothetical protein RBB50_011998 [Rhinocladiella similis]
MDIILTDDYESRVKYLLSKYHVPGLSISITNANRIVSKGFGLANVDPPRPATPETIFDCSWASKSLTAAAVATLVAKERFQWTTLLRDLLPDFRFLSHNKPKVEDMLSHRTGVPGHDYSLMGQTAQHPDTPASVTRKVCRLELTDDRVDFYSNLMYTTASYLVELVAGQSFESYLTTHVLTPLGMDSTYLQPSAVRAAHQSHHAAMEYVYKPRTNSYEAVKSRDKPECQGASMIQTSTDDFVKWLRAQLTLDSALFEPQMYASLLKPRTRNNNFEPRPHTLDPQYALGWNVRHYRGQRLVYQDGKARAIFLPNVDEPFGFVILGNSANAQHVAEILSMELIDELIGVPETERGDWEALQDGLVVLNRERDIQTFGEVEGQAQCSCFGNWGYEPDETTKQLPSAVPYPLTAYTGRYRHPGYRDIVVTTKWVSPAPENDAAPSSMSDTWSTRIEKLYIDATDRTDPFTLTLDHFCFCNCRGRPSTKFIALQKSPEPGQEQRSEFLYVEALMKDDDPDEEMDLAGVEQQPPIVAQIGLDLCRELRFPELIWFTRVFDSGEEHATLTGHTANHIDKVSSSHVQC